MYVRVAVDLENEKVLIKNTTSISKSRTRDKVRPRSLKVKMGQKFDLDFEKSTDLKSRFNQKIPRISFHRQHHLI